MIKFGVTERGEFARHALEQEQQHRGWWPFAYTLLDDAGVAESDFEERLMTRLYQSLAAGEGVYKITRPGRFVALDERLVEDCRTRFPDRSHPLVIHDMAASNGITSLELLERMQPDRPAMVHASDYFDRLYLVTPSGSNWTVTIDATGRPLQMSNHRFVVSAYRQEPLRYALNRLVQSWARSKILPAAVEIFRCHASSPGSTDAVRSVRLFHRRCLAAADRPDSRFTVSRHDACTPNPFACDIVRVMNFLTRGHLPLARLSEAIRLACHQLRPGGVLLLGRTIDEEDGRIRATAFVRQGDGLAVAWTMNDGYEETETALQTSLAGVPA